MKKLWILVAFLFVVCALGAGMAWQSYAADAGDESPQIGAGDQVPQVPPGPGPGQRPGLQGDRPPQVPGQGFGGQFQGRGFGGNPVMLVDGNFLYVLNGNMLFKVDKARLQQVGTLRLEGPRMEIPGPLPPGGDEN